MLVAMRGAAMDAQQVATSGSQPEFLRSGKTLSAEDDEGVIEEYFGQLWWIPRSPPPRVNQRSPHLLWICKDLWEGKSFSMADCFPVQPGDVLKQDWKELDFARDVWGKGERDSFLQVLREGMAGRAARGRGRVGEEGRITGERGRIGGTWAIIPVSLLSSSNPLLVSTPIHHRCSTCISHTCSFRGEGKVLDSISSSTNTGRGLRTITDLGQGSTETEARDIGRSKTRGRKKI
jgi:hypothetical protein